MKEYAKQFFTRASKRMLSFLNDSITKISQVDLEVQFISLFEISHGFF
jgi:hypothetical protein